MATFDIGRLTPQERLDLIGELWDGLSGEDVRLAPVQDAELTRRMASFDAAAKSATQVDAELDRRTL